MTQPEHRDELTLRYLEASAQDTRRPDHRVREAVRAHAQTVIAASQQNIAGVAPQVPAANQPRWKISMLASLAMLGLTGLLVLQFDRGTPEEKQLVNGGPSASISTAPQPTQPLPETPAIGPTPPVASIGEPARKESDAPLGTARQPTRKAAVEPPAPPVPLAAAPARLSDTAAAASTEVAGVQSRGAVVPDLAPALRAAPAARAQQAPRYRSEAGSAEDLTSALHAITRQGNVAQLEPLLVLGASINAPDDAGRTPLMLAVIHGHADMVQRLLAAGANPALVDRENLTALQHARRLGLERIARLLEARS